MVRGSKCPMGAYILLHADSDKCSFYRTRLTHDHESSGKKDDASLRAKVEELFHDGYTTPTQIISKLREENIQEPTTSQMNYWLKLVREDLYGPARLNLNDLKEWCIKHSVVPVDVDQMFVGKYEIGLDRDKKPYFRFFVATKRLLEYLLLVEHIVADTTYKVVWQGYPLLMVGTTDKNCKYHPFGVCLSIRETHIDYAFMFTALDETCFNVLHKRANTNVLIGDAAAAITNGFVKAYTKCVKKVICWAHVIRNVDVKLKPIRAKLIKQAIRKDILNLQLANSEDIFNRASKLLVEKWINNSTAGVTTFINYFNDQWLKTNQNWYEGYADGKYFIKKMYLKEK